MPEPDTSSPSRQSPVPLDQCGAALALEMMPDRWTWLILRDLFFGITRFSDIQTGIGIPKSVLSGRLSKMVENGLAQREPYRDGAARTRYEYVLTGKGRDLVPVILALMQWGDKHLRNGKSALAVTDKRSGLPVKVALVTEGGLPLRRLKYKADPDQTD